MDQEYLQLDTALVIAKIAVLYGSAKRESTRKGYANFPAFVSPYSLDAVNVRVSASFTTTKDVEVDVAEDEPKLSENKRVVTIIPFHTTAEIIKNFPHRFQKLSLEDEGVDLIDPSSTADIEP